MRLMFIVLILIILLVGGCGISNENKSVSPSEMNANDPPDVPALQDEFTREFLQSVEPVENRYYPFKSKTESFTMSFPEDLLLIKEVTMWVRKIIVSLYQCLKLMSKKKLL